jgi:long-subunit acyl-CoA synthetase (AMP-forming)
VLAEVERAVSVATERLPRVEQIMRFRLSAAAWDSATGELTPTLKRHRPAIRERQAEDIGALYR